MEKSILIIFLMFKVQFLNIQENNNQIILLNEMEHSNMLNNNNLI